MNSPLQKTLRLLAALAALVGLVGLGSCGGGGSDGPAEQTIALFSPIADQRFSAVPVSLTALSSSGLAVAFSSATASVCTVNGSTAVLVNVGTCTVAANQAGNDNFLPAATVTRSFAVTQADQVITFVSPGNQVFGVAPPALMAMSTSGLPVNIVSATPAVCTVAGTTLSLLGLGDCTLAAVQAGNNTFRAAAVVQQTFAISSRGQAQTISFASPGSQMLNVAPAALAANASSGLAVSFASTTPAVCSVAGTALSLLTSGTCTVAASQGGDQNFAAAPAVLNTFTVSGRAQSITFSSPGDQTLGVQPAALVGTATSGLAVSFSSTTPTVCSVNGTVLGLVGAGSCSLTANQGGNTLFAVATPVVRAFNVARAAQVISFAGPGNQTLGTAAPALAATSSLGLEISFASTTPAVCTTSGTALALVATGTCTITASQPGNALAAAAVSVSRSFQVAAAPLTAQTISFASPGNQTLGTPPAALVFSASSGLAVTVTSATTGVCGVSGTTLTLLSAGACTLSANQPGNANVAAAAVVTHSFVVGTAPLTAQTITFAGPGNQTVGVGPLALVATSSASLPVSFAASPSGVCSVSGTTLTIQAAGTCTVIATQSGNSTIAAATPVSRDITVARAAQTISFTNPVAQVANTTINLSAQASPSGLTVTFTLPTTTVCSLSGNTLNLLTAGTCTVTANQPGNTIFAPASADRSFSVSLASQTLTFAGPGPQTLGSSPVTLSATTTSPLVVTFESSTPSVCEVNGTALALLSAGPCTVLASQQGNLTFAPAAAVSRTFSVAAAAIELFANGGFETVGVTTPALAWLQAANGYTRSADARSGSFSAQLGSAAFGAAVMLQNSVEQGARPPLMVGSSPVLSFWAKGTAGGTGNVLFALRYLDGIGNIKYNSQNQFFQARINPNTWTLIAFTPPPVPAGSVAAFIEFSQAIGPISTNPGEEAGLVLIDDLSLK